MDNRRVLLVGAGDLGLRVAHELLARGDQVWALRRRPAATEHERLHWLPADVTLPDTLRGLPGGITHLVWVTAPDERTPEAYARVFTEGLKHVFGAIDRSHLQRVVFVSSSAVYGAHDGGWVDETTPPAPAGYNGRILLESERWLTQQGLPSVALRLAGIYGPNRDRLLERLRAGTAHAPIDPPHWANRIHADDAARAIAHVLTLPKAQPVYIVCDDTPLPLHVLYGSLADMLGAPPPAQGPAPMGVGSKRLDNTLLKSSGYVLRWPDARAGYAALINAA